MWPAVSLSARSEVVVDSVVLHYFLLVDATDLLLRLLGSPLQVPRIVYDPEEAPETPPAAMSEMTRAIDYHDRRTNDPTRPPDARAAIKQSFDRLRVIHVMYERRDLRVVDMTSTELALYAKLTNPERMDEVGLRFPLGAGEAACIALAIHRGWALATDDNDALTALQALSPNHRYERIRKLLITAVELSYITREEANDIHTAMRAVGFRDKAKPFP